MTSGTTADNLEVPEGYRLEFCPLELELVGWDGTVLAVALQWQVECRWQRSDKRRPHLIVYLLGACIQSGWLWSKLG